MSKVDSLMRIKECWSDKNASLYDRVCVISEEYYASSLKLDSTAAYIGATPTELDALLTLSELDDDLLRKISIANPPKTTWLILANANDEEIGAALRELSDGRSRGVPDNKESVEERLFSAMIQVSGPTVEQKVATLPPDVLYAMAKRAESFKALTERNTKAMKSMAGYRKRGKTLSEKQVSYLMSMLNDMVAQGAIVRNGIDSDQKMCDAVLDALDL